MHREEHNDRVKLYSQEHRADKVEYDKHYRQAQSDHIRIIKQNYYVAHKERLSKVNQAYRDVHKEDRKEYDRKHNRERRMCDICDTSIRAKDFAAHERTAKHKLNLQEVKSI